ncbi:MAG TPA: response regulator [Byssovorax sp.]
MDDALLLFVDPDEALQRAVIAAAVGTGVRVVAVEDARRALNLARVIAPAIVVTELELPAEDGVWLASQLRAEVTLELTPIVLVTSSRELSTRLRALENGVDILVNKPIDAVGVLGQVRALGAMAGRIQDRSAVSGVMNRPALDDEPAVTARPPLQGDLAVMPVSTVFTILELDQMSGVLEVPLSATERLLVHVASGYVERGERSGTVLAPADAVRAALAPKGGHFEFRVGPKKKPPRDATPTTRYIWAAVDDAAKSSLSLGRLGDEDVT